MRKLLHELDPVRLYKNSRAYMQGYSNWYFFTHLPRAFTRYYWFVFSDLMRGRP